MVEGELVIVTGKLDTRVRQKQQAEGELIIGTLIFIDPQNMVWVLLPDADIWRGPKREICRAAEQLPAKPISANQTASIVAISVSV